MPRGGKAYEAPMIFDRLRTHVSGLLGGARLSFAQEGEDLVLARIFGDQRDGVYVDVGAHHPRRFSNTYLLYQRGWHGVNIDASPGSMAPFRRERPRDINLEMGVAPVAESRRFYQFDEPALNTFDLERVATLRTTQYRLISEHDIRCAPLAEILREHDVGAIDLLTIDVEGYDEQVLRTLDWEKSRPRVVIVEQFSRDLEAHFESSVHRFMRGNGYRLFAKTFNSVFYQRTP